MEMAGTVPAKFTQVRGTKVEMARIEPAKFTQVQEYTDRTGVVKG